MIDIIQQTIIIDNLTALAKFAQKITSYLSSQSTIILLYGDLGTGKTTWTKFFVESLGSQQIVTSPTFNIHQKYRLPGNQKNINHFDFYRMKNKWATADQNNFMQAMMQASINIIEWPNPLWTYQKLSDQVITITFKKVTNNLSKRRIIWKIQR